MSRYEVTFAEYDEFARATGRKRPDSKDWDRKTHPVVFVSWDDTYQYAMWLSKQTGHKYRLPSEAEWEYAARAGQETDYWWGRRVGTENAHCFDCKSGLHPRRAAKVGYFKPSPYGLYDTAGNVWEWVHDCYHPNYRGAPDDGSVWEGGDCTRRVARGGSFASASGSLRASKREKFVSHKKYDDVGIRLVRDLD
jgi:formylglycine-generating enzyme required for sulfatase activity